MKEKKVTVSFCLPEDLVNRIDSIAQDYQISRSAALRLLIGKNVLNSLYGKSVMDLNTSNLETAKQILGE